MLMGKALISQNLGSCSGLGTELLHDYLESCLTCWLLTLANITWEWKGQAGSGRALELNVLQCGDQKLWRSAEY